MTKCTFKQPWRAYQAGDTADLKDDRAAELAAGGYVEIIQGPPAPPASEDGPEYDTSELAAALDRTINELRLRLEEAQAQAREWKEKYTALYQQTQQAPAEETPAAAPAEAPPAPEQVDGATLFTELNLPESIRQKMADAGLRTIEDIRAAQAQEDGLVGLPGIGKVTAQQIEEELAKLEPAEETTEEPADTSEPTTEKPSGGFQL